MSRVICSAPAAFIAISLSPSLASFSFSIQGFLCSTPAVTCRALSASARALSASARALSASARAAASIAATSLLRSCRTQSGPWSPLRLHKSAAAVPASSSLGKPRPVSLLASVCAARGFAAATANIVGTTICAAAFRIPDATDMIAPASVSQARASARALKWVHAPACVMREHDETTSLRRFTSSAAAASPRWYKRVPVAVAPMAQIAARATDRMAAG